MINRILYNSLEKNVKKDKAIVLLGPRQVGKTTLIQEFLKNKDCLFLSGDDPEVRVLLENAGTTKLQAILGNYEWVFIDEAQRIKGIGLTAKLITDNFKKVQLFISGSSALEINDHTQEPLTGRKYEYQLFPISWEEFEKNVGYLEANSQQLGNEVSYNELSKLLEVDKATIAKYIDLLEKLFIIVKLNSFSRNQRNEIKHNRKIYFYDNGIRNMLINNLNPLDSRNDKGALWENFLIVERLKIQHYHQLFTNNYFWRTVQKQEIDFVEERNGQLVAFEFKWKKKNSDKIPASFLEKYNATGTIIDKDNFRDFVLLVR